MKTNELKDLALDWAVATCKGLVVEIVPQDGKYPAGLFHASARGGWYEPSTDWAQGGPIIEREEISTVWANGQWESHTVNDQDEYAQIEYGPTPLIAAMRCFCCAKLGDEIDIPEELCQQQNS